MPASIQTAAKADEVLSSKVSSAPPLRPRRSIFRVLVELVLGVVLVGVLIELIFAWAGVGEQEYLCSDKDLGYAHMAGKSMTWRSEGFSRSHFNSHGMLDRERTFEKAPGTYRIAILGDSWVEALQVDRDKNFCNVLERMLNDQARNGGDRATPAKFEVLNCGVAAYNLAQNYLQLKTKILKFHPDLVITAVRADSSLLLVANPNEGFLYARPNFFTDGKGGLIEDRTVQKMWLSSKAGRRMEANFWLRRNSHIWGVISSCAEALTTWTKAGGFRPASTAKLMTQKGGDAGGEADVQSLDKNYVIKGKADRMKGKQNDGGGTISDAWPEADPKAEAATKFLAPTVA
ncbi:MAG: hypothetical protein K2Z81_15185, partial [Cyanobacteria bacterium]|nr:hypothetical protein [Cyanobacteriota bacterium]